MPASQELLDSLRPREARLIYELVRDAGVDVGHWSIDVQGAAIDPHVNTYKNSQWTFGGGKEPMVACIWWSELGLLDGEIVRDGNSKEDSNGWMNRLATHERSREVGDRLRPKIKKAQAFDRMMSEAFLRRKPVRVVLLDGTRATREQAEFQSSSAYLRTLDAEPWYVHAYDVTTGKYKLVRSELPPPTPVVDPFEGAEDPGLDPNLEAFLDDPRLSSTEKEAIIKLRVGQGWFREALKKRWNGCAVTGCANLPLLVASHIQPWSQCLTRAERLSPDNGLLLTPNLDKLFDGGFISFGDNFKIMISPQLSPGQQNELRVDPHMQLRQKVFSGMKPFLQWHRDNLFRADRSPRPMDDA